MTLYLKSEYLEKQALSPEWDKATKVHDWRNYTSEGIKEIWSSFTDEQKCAIVEMLDELAAQENWD